MIKFIKKHLVKEPTLPWYVEAIQAVLAVLILAFMLYCLFS